MDVAVHDGMVEIRFRDATPEKFGVAMKKLAKGVEEAGKGRFPDALKLFRDVLAVIPENVDARRNMAKAYLGMGTWKRQSSTCMSASRSTPWTTGAMSCWATFTHATKTTWKWRPSIMRNVWSTIPKMPWS